MQRETTAGISVFAVVLTCIGTTVVTHFGEFAVGVLGSAFTEDLGAEPSQLGFLIALMFACSALGAIPSGFLADRIDPRRLILIQVTFASLAFGSFALALQAGQLFLSVALVGFAISLNGPMTNRLVIDFVPLRSQRTAVAWKSMGLQTSGLLTGLTFGLTEPFSPWRTTIMVTVVLMLLLGLAAHLRFRTARPLEHDWHGRSSGAETPASTGADAESTVSAVSGPPARESIAEPLIWWMVPYALFTVGAFTAIGTYMVLYATDEVGITAATAANASGIAAGISILARFVWVRWLTERNEVFMLILTALTGAIAVALLAVSPWFGPWMFWVSVAAMGGTVLGTSPVRQVIMLRNTNPRYIGRVSSIIQVASAASLAGMPFLIAQFVNTLGMQPTWFIVVGISMLGVLTMLLYAILHVRGSRSPGRRAVATKRM